MATAPLIGPQFFKKYRSKRCSEAKPMKLHGMDQPDYVTALGYWYHKCPKTGVERRIGFNYNIVKDNGRCPAYESCYQCGAKRPTDVTQ
jgi:hypothetical protein